METKFVRVPFEIELAKEITNGTKKGRIVTRDGNDVRILCFDANMIDFPIVALIKEYGGNSLVTRTSDGKVHLLAPDSEPRSLMLEIPEYMTFKDGDIVGFGSGSVGIFQKIDSGGNTFSSYATLCGNTLIYYEPAWRLANSRKATEEEIQKLIDALKESKEPKAKEILKQFFGIEEKKEFEFKPFDKVLVRDSYTERWNINIFSYIKNEDEYIYCCISQCWKQCIPYNENTAHLLGTTEDYKQINNNYASKD